MVKKEIVEPPPPFANVDRSKCKHPHINDYDVWSFWAAEKSRNHNSVQCCNCGKYGLIWKKK